jgi:hypothetical protein
MLAEFVVLLQGDTSLCDFAMNARYRPLGTVSYRHALLDRGMRQHGIDGPRRNNVSHHQLENDLTHLERIVPRLIISTQHARVYWNGRITALKAVQAMLPNGALRVTRLLKLVEKLDSRSDRP